MNILADVAAGGDRDKLRKMMEQGQVDVYKYLPLVFEEMRKRAQIGLEEYYKSILYQQRRVERANEAFLRTFMDAGASEGMLSIYRAFAQAVEDTIPMADLLGEAFRRAGHIISAAIVAPKELFDWFSGKSGEGNFMTLLFGDKPESTFQAIEDQLIRLGRNLDGLPKVNDFSMWKSTLKEIELILKAIAATLEWVNNAIESTRVLKFEGVSAFFKHTSERRDIDDAREIAKAQLQKENPNYTEAELADRTSQIFVATQRKREQSLIPRMFQSDLKDAPEKWLEDFQPNGDPYDPLGGNFNAPPLAQDIYPEGSSLSLSPPYSESSLPPVGVMGRAIRKVQPVPEYGPEGTLPSSPIIPEVKIIVSGGITVDGELGTMIDDTNLSEKFNEQIEQMLYGTRPQFSVVHR